MSRIPRTKLIDPDKIQVHHCFNRTAQGLFLCGWDKVAEMDYSHRKQWFINRLIYLAHLFVIDVGAHAILSTHFHVILRNRPDLGRALSDREVILRWHELFPGRREPDGGRRRLSESEIETQLSQPNHVAKLRRRLSDISWFMKALQENIARRANAASEKSGHFFGGRFESVRLLDEEALIACAVYVDLNEVRAQVADLPEHSRFSSVWQRLDGLQCRLGDPGFLGEDLPEEMRFGARNLNDEDTFRDGTPSVSRRRDVAGDQADGADEMEGLDGVTDVSAERDTGRLTEPEDVLGDSSKGPVPLRRESRGQGERASGVQAERMRRARKLGTARAGDRDYWLSPIDESVALPCLGVEGREVEFQVDVPATTRLNRGGWLPMSMEQYLRVLDWTGRQIRSGKRGAIPQEMAPLLERLGVDVEGWCELATNFRGLFSYAAGVASRMEAFAEEIGQRWFRSTRNSRRLFGCR